ncbi:MAG: hypothetical protein ACXVW2_01345 [Nocardioidaceae bacterium]
MAELRVGHGTVRLPVPPGTPMAGYVARTGCATGTLDELEVSATAFTAGGRTVVLCVADVLAVDVDLAASCATAVAGAAGLTLHHGLLHGVGGQRCGPQRRTTVPASVLAVRDGARATGPVVGLLAVLAVHPTVLPAANREVSADLPGAVRRALAGHVRWSVVATGAAGDMSTRASRRAQTPAEVDRLGTEAAGQLRALLDTSPAAAADPALGVEAARGVLPLAPVPAATREARAAAVAAARAALAAAPTTRRCSATPAATAATCPPRTPTAATTTRCWSAGSHPGSPSAPCRGPPTCTTVRPAAQNLLPSAVARSRAARTRKRQSLSPAFPQSRLHPCGRIRLTSRP